MPLHFCQSNHLLTSISTAYGRAAGGAAMLAGGLLYCAALQAEPWQAPGDGRLRHDLELLSDAGLVHAPLTAWPVSWPEIARDVGGVNAAEQPLYVQAALARVRAAATAETAAGELEFEARISGSEQPMALRRFD